MSGFFYERSLYDKKESLSYTEHNYGLETVELSLFQKPTCGKIIVIIYF